ncbi:hypothetical protein TSAR_013339 [Trichomalopsis sarcophagae]|uniref:Uncharacterized protein n=1 Tax=Trichomalopsis sarcophagae TaxID=543379 RepID=A0A232EHF3_9HYME|nr:hypothetical protein TSAR_013339 [Trichomalopsis sarcophagae]
MQKHVEQWLFFDEFEGPIIQCHKALFGVGTCFFILLNMYNKRKKVVGACPNICFFSVSLTRKWHFSRRIAHIGNIRTGIYIKNFCS